MFSARKRNSNDRDQKVCKGSQAEYLRKLAASFAIAVTVDTSLGRGYIDRHGNSTVFNALRRVLPQV